MPFYPERARSTRYLLRRSDRAREQLVCLAQRPCVPGTTGPAGVTACTRTSTCSQWRLLSRLAAPVERPGLSPVDDR
jgi:hypothetical protein